MREREIMFKLLVCLCVLYICLVYSNDVYILVQCVMILVIMYVLYIYIYI